MNFVARILPLLMITLFIQVTFAADSPTPSNPTTAAPAEYRPSMGDLMTMAVQPRHIKLGLAGASHNWAYATFEISELRNAFARIARTIPVYQNSDTAKMVSSMIERELKEVEASIKAHDAHEFTESYRRLTQACNACHQVQNHAFVVIKEPRAAAYPDQEFRPTNDH